MNPELQHRVDQIKHSAAGLVLCEVFADQLETIKAALCSAPPEHVQRLQGQAAAYLDLIRRFTKTRE